ncbi:MAG: ABC transporter substrate-binding protein, partial [Desulfosarcina sp.]|nr:ABC transporter substrate-binding protein [Desulfobacterales bacterium]
MNKILFLVVLFASFSVYAQDLSNELVIAMPFGPSVKAVDPAQGYNGWYTNEAGVTETLFVLDFDLNLAPWLAESYKNVTPLAWEIKLKKGVRFHDNRAFDATAVKWTFNRIIDKNSPVFNKRLHGLLDIKKITVLDKYTILFETNRPNGSFLYNLTSPGTGIISSKSKGKNIYGTGPFMLKKVIPNEQVVVSRFNGYWGGKPKLAVACLKIIKNPATRMLAFEAGQVDIAASFPETDAERIKSRKGVKIISKPTTRLCFFFIRVAEGPLSDPVIRKALNYAINRDEIVKSVLAGMGGEMVSAIFPQVFPWSKKDLKPYPYNPVMASKLLAEAGAVDENKDGILEIKGSPLILNAWTYEGRPSLKPTLELVQEHLTRVGIALNLKITKKGSPINRAMQKGYVHLNLQMWNTALQGDPDYFISQVFPSGQASNFMGYENPELDRLAEKGKKSFDFKERKTIYDKIQKIIYDDSPVIVLFHKSMVSAVCDYVENYQIHPA